jgi:cell division protein YceG involved in septum cleavage
MVITIIIIILLTIIILACIGVSIVVKNNNAEKEETEKILLSGKYSVALTPVAESLAKKKPTKAELEEWLNSQGASEEQKSKYLESWQNSINEIIKTINEGDMNEVKAYQIVPGKKSENICKFLPQDNFITRDQIIRNSEILPPYFFGCDCIVVPKPPTSTGSWKTIAPKNGSYELPDWRQMV